MNTPVKEFQNYLKSIGFNISPVLNSLPLNPSYYKTPEKHHFLTSAIHVSIFSGALTKNGDLGCVTFCYHGKLKRKGCRNTNTRPEMLKKIMLPLNAQQAIDQLKQWMQSSQKTLSQWEQVI